MPAEYLACVKSEIAGGKSRKDAQRICAISYEKKHGKSVQEAAGEHAKNYSPKGMMHMKNESKNDISKFSIKDLARDQNETGPRDSPDKHEEAKSMPEKVVENIDAGTKDVKTVNADPSAAGGQPGEPNATAAMPEAQYHKEREVISTKENLKNVADYAASAPAVVDMVKFFTPITKIDAERHMVFGYATTDTKDSQGESVDLAASFEAADEWSDWSTIKEMHKQDTAAGVAVEIEKHAGIGLYIGAEIVDPVAWAKCEKKVYKGFSIGGKCLARDPENPKRITKYQLVEISLVDRPANPDSMFVVAKRDESEIDINASQKGAAGENMTKEGTPAAAPAIDMAMAKAAAEKDEVIKKLTADLELSKKNASEMQAKVDELAKQSTVKAEILKAVGDLSPELKRAVEKMDQPIKTPAQMEAELVSKMSLGELTGLMLKTAHNSAGGTVGTRR